MVYVYLKFTCGICKITKKGKGYDPKPLKIKANVCKRCYEDEVQRIKVNIAFSQMGLLEDLNHLI